MCILAARSPLMTEVVTSSAEEVAKVGTTLSALEQGASSSKSKKASSPSLPAINSNIKSENAAKTAILFDDVFDTGDETNEPQKENTLAQNRNLSHPTSFFSNNVSDVPRLRSVHVTAGYRDGIADGKTRSVQAGFDEGYSLGAVMGLNVGWIMGILDGLIVAMAMKRQKHMKMWKKGNTQQLSSGTANMAAGHWANLFTKDEGLKLPSENPPGYQDEKQNISATENTKTDEHNYVIFRLRALQFEAEKGLSAANIFGSEFFGDDGIWLYDVPRTSEDSDGIDHIGGFEEVAAAHPQIKAWREVALQWAERLEIDINAIEQLND